MSLTHLHVFRCESVKRLQVIVQVPLLAATRLLHNLLGGPLLILERAAQLLQLSKVGYEREKERQNVNTQTVAINLTLQLK